MKSKKHKKQKSEEQIANNKIGFIRQLLIDLEASDYEWNKSMIFFIFFGDIIFSIGVMFTLLAMRASIISIRYYVPVLIFYLALLILWIIIYNIIAKVCIKKHNDMRLTWVTAVYIMSLGTMFLTYTFLLIYVMVYRICLYIQ